MRLCTTLCMFILFTGSALAAEDSRITTNIGLGWNTLEFKQQNNENVVARYPTINIGTTFQSGNYYGKLSAELFGVDNQEKFNGTDYEITSVERQDATLTLGMQTMDRLSIFAGYTVGEMKDDFYGNFHEDKGSFAGFGYNVPVNQSSLGLSLAYADISTEIRTDGAAPGDPIPTAEGDTTGLSIGLSWSGEYRNNMGYFIGLRARRYDFDANDAAYDADKNITSIEMGLIL